MHGIMCPIVNQVHKTITDTVLTFVVPVTQQVNPLEYPGTKMPMNELSHFTRKLRWSS
jgi:hypothetical protein